MAYSHRETDARSCGATTDVVLQDFVRVEGQLWAVEGDPNTHGAGQLIASVDYVFINGLNIIVVGDNAQPDNLCPFPGGNHCNPTAVGYSDLINVG